MDENPYEAPQVATPHPKPLGKPLRLPRTDDENKFWLFFALLAGIVLVSSTPIVALIAFALIGLFWLIERLRNKR